MKKTRGQVGSRVLRGAAKVGVRRQPRRNPLTGVVPPERPDAETLARLAGARGRPAPGLDNVARLGNYKEQNGPPYKTTPRQERRLRHKAHHRLAMAGRAIDRHADLSAVRARLALTGAPAMADDRQWQEWHKRPRLTRTQRREMARLRRIRADVAARGGDRRGADRAA